jgi:hypothetical protein
MKLFIGMLQRSNQRKSRGRGNELEQICIWVMLIMLIYWAKQQIPTKEPVMILV